MKLCLAFVLLLLLVSCAGRTYRPESVAAKMQRYEGQQAQVAIQNWRVDDQYFQHSSAARQPASTAKTISIPRPLGQIYFLSLVEQYYQLGQFLPENTAPLKICANFHDVLVREALYPPPAKKPLILPSRAVMAQHQVLYPISQLPLGEEEEQILTASPAQDDTPASFATLISLTESSPAELAQAAEQALRGQQARILAELQQLCDTESGRSVNSDNYLNLVQFKNQHPLTPSAHHVTVLFKIFPLSNWALLDSLGMPLENGSYTNLVLQSLGANWLKDYLQAQKVQRNLVAQD